MSEITQPVVDAGPLTSVVFIHDCIQLVFQGLTMSIYASCEIIDGSQTISSGDAGYADCLVSLIGHSVTQVEDQEDSLNLIFESDMAMRIADDGTGPEAYSLHQDGRSTVVG